MGAGATTETGRPFPGAEDFAVGSATVTPVEADVPLVEADAASVEVDMPSVEVDMPSVEVDMPSVEAEAEAVPMVVGAGRLHHQLEALAADSICCRLLRFRSRGAAASCGPRRASRGIGRGGYDIVQPDCNQVGVTEAWHIARVGNLRKKYCCPHNWHGGLSTMANAALVAAIPNHLVLELNQTYNPLKEEIFKEPLVVKKGYMDLPSKPGFGVEVIEDVAKKFPYLPGSYTRPNPDLPS
jgi:hypothetical protein